MDAVAYIDPAVIEFITENLIPIRILASDSYLGPKFKIKWTPTLLVLDASGTEHYRTLGFYPPKDLIPSLLLGMGKAMFDQPESKGAADYFERLVAEFPNSALAPEALYLNGVCRFLENHDISHLIGIYDRLAADYADSPWLTRADPYKLLKG